MASGKDVDCGGENSISIVDSGFYQGSWLLCKTLVVHFSQSESVTTVGGEENHSEPFLLLADSGQSIFGKNHLSKSRSWENGAKVKISGKRASGGNESQFWRSRFVGFSQPTCGDLGPKS